MSSLFARTISRNLRGCQRLYHDKRAPILIPDASLDEATVPEGSWQEAYDKKQQKGNIHLGLSLLFAALTFYVAKTTPYFPLYWGYPEPPADEKK